MTGARRAVVSASAFADGDLGTICAVSGRPTSGRMRVTARHLPRWPLALIVFGPVGIVVALVVPWCLQHRVEGVLPCDRLEASRVCRSRRLAWAAVVAIAAATFAAMWWTSVRFSAGMAVGICLIGVLGVTLGLVRAARPPGSILVRLDRSGHWVILDGVAPAFAASVGAPSARPVAAGSR